MFLTRTLSIITVMLALLPAPAFAAEQDPAVTKMRDQLRNAMLQLRTIQGERDTLAASKTQLEQEKTALQTKFDSLVKQAAADKEASDKTAAAMDAKIAANELEISNLRTSLEKWKASQAQAVELARKTESERQKLALRKIELERQVSDQQMKNTAMFKVGNEILDRYEKFGLGTAITAREPFVGITRVKLQNLVQDYGDRLVDQKIKP
jgi:chromosome segregation ATPase